MDQPLLGRIMAVAYLMLEQLTIQQLWQHIAPQVIRILLIMLHMTSLILATQQQLLL